MNRALHVSPPAARRRPQQRQPLEEQRVVDWCPSLPGFGIRRYASGRRVFVVQFRGNGGVQHLLTLGKEPILTEHQARKTAKFLIHCTLDGKDPALARSEARRRPPWPVFLEEYWLAASPRWKPGTRRSHDQYRQHWLERAFGLDFIDEITPARVARWFVGLSDTCGKGGANRCLAIFSAAMTKAEDWGYIEHGRNPCLGIKPNPKRRVEQVLSKESLTRVGAVLEADRAQGERKASAILLLLLTGCRKSEILNLTWSDIRADRLILRDSKTGPRAVVLGDDAKAIITALPKLGNAEALFYSKRTRKPMININRYWRQICQRAGIAPTRVHDLRHTFASHCACMKEPLPMVSRLLGHSSIRSTARYAHLDDSALMEACERIGGRIAEMMGV